MTENDLQEQDDIELVPDENGLSDRSNGPMKKIEKLKKELDVCQKEKEDYLAGWQRAKADYLNFKREKELGSELLKEISQAELWRKVLEVAGALERAQKTLPHNLMTNDWANGILRIQEQLQKLFRDEKIEPIEVVGKLYDPEIAEVVMSVKDALHEDGTMVEELEKGYYYKKNGKRLLLRPAKVKIVKN